ncbi:MAG: hypothetical protein IT173_12110 [Acidobacteria bacterium]|nr:hypothetical protein [Acidobacteriota bacterium]
MNEKQIKRHFEDRGLRISDVAKTMQEDFPGITLNSADVMLRQLIAGARWYPIYAKWLKSKFGVTVDQPAWVPGVRERMRRLAA